MSTPVPPPGDAPERYALRGPSPETTTLGVVLLVAALVVLAEELFGASIDWLRVGPWVVMGAGSVIVLVGLLGLLTARRRD